MSDQTRRYVFAPLERKGAIAGLSGAQVGLVGGGLALDVVLLRLVPNVAGILLATMILVVATGLAFMPFGGRSVDQWVPVAGRHAARVVSGRHHGRFRDTRLAVPAAFAGLDFDEVLRPAAGPVGVIVDKTSASVTAVLAVRGRSFALLDGADKERRLSSWSSILAGLSREGSPIRSVQWIERLVPGDSEALTHHYEAARTLAPDAPASRSYANLIAEAGPLGQDHECFVALTLSTKVRRNQASSDVVLLREVGLLERQVRDAELDVERFLDLDSIGAVLRTAFDPWARAGRSRHLRRGCPPAAAWPVGSDESWSWWRTDETWHATFWVAEWPRSEVGPEFLSPLLLHTSCQRSVAVIMTPLPPSAGIREAEAARTAHAADEQLRARAGFLSTARRARQAEGIALRETELSDGHAAYRFTGYVTVTGRSLEALEDACGEVVQTGHQCRLELRRLHGIQDLAFGWTTPVGRGSAR